MVRRIQKPLDSSTIDLSKLLHFSFHQFPITCPSLINNRSSMAISQTHPLLLLFLSLFLLPTLRATSFHYCDKKLDPVKVKGVEISPYPVVSGQAATFKISGSTAENIPGGKVVIKVSLFGIPVHTETHDLCEETACPISPGSFVLSHSQTLPSFTPPGTYTLKMTIKDENGGRLTCISFKFKITLDSTVSVS